MLCDKEERFGYFLDHCPYCTVCTIDKDGFPNAKAIYGPVLRDRLTRLYFITNAYTLRSSQFVYNPKCCLYFCREEKQLGLMLTGYMQITSQQSLKDKVYNPKLKTYYPEFAEDDENMRVLTFTTETGRYTYSKKSLFFTVIE